MPRDTYVRIGEAARLVGKSVDTLRRWEAEGKLSAVRSVGGQREYRLADILRLLNDDDDNNEEMGSAAAVTGPPSRPAAASVPPWKVREANAAADLSVTKLRIDRREEVRRYREAEQRRIEAERADAQDRAAAARLQAAQTAERNRLQRDLDHCLHLIRIRLMWEPPAVCAEVERFLADHATPGAALPWLRAEATAIVDRHRAEREAAAKRESDAALKRLQVLCEESGDKIKSTQLLRHGESFAKKLTSDGEQWDAEIAKEAVEEVKDRLAEVVEPTWTEKRVEREVADMLAEWD